MVDLPKIGLLTLVKSTVLCSDPFPCSDGVGVACLPLQDKDIANWHFVQPLPVIVSCKTDSLLNQNRNVFF